MNRAELHNQEQKDSKYLIKTSECKILAFSMLRNNDKKTENPILIVSKKILLGA